MFNVSTNLDQLIDQFGQVLTNLDQFRLIWKKYPNLETTNKLEPINNLRSIYKKVHKKGHRTKLAFVDPRNWLSEQGGSELKILIEHQ